MFCQLYFLHKDYRGNGTLSYAIAYDYDLDSLSDTDGPCLEYEEKLGVHEGEEEKHVLADRCIRHEPSERRKAENVCANAASRLLRTSKILLRRKELLNNFLKDEDVDAEMAELILDDVNPSAKLGAIKEYNHLRKRTTDDGGAPITNNFFLAFVQAAQQRLAPTPVAATIIEPAPAAQFSTTTTVTQKSAKEILKEIST